MTHCGMVGIMCGSGSTMLVCGGATLGSAGGSGYPLRGATLGGGAFRSRNGGGVLSCEMTLLPVLDVADTIVVGYGASAMVVMLGAGFEGSCVCGGVHAVCCVKMSAI
jgi:hypothetical protein